MPTIRTPDGRRLRVPEGATQEQIYAVIESQVGGQPASTPDFSNVRSGSSPTVQQAPRVKTVSENLATIGLLPKSLEMPAQYVENALRGARHGLSLNLSDEMVGARDALFAGLTGGDAAKEYRRSRDLERARLRQFSEDYPAASVISNIGGGLLTGGVGGARSAGTQAVSGIGKRLLTSAGTGAAVGGVAGLGAGEGSAEEQIQSAGKGALIGGAVAPALTGLLAGVSGLSRLMPGRSAAVAPPAPAPGAAPQPAAGTLPATVRERALASVRHTLDRSGQTAESVERQLAEAEALGYKPEVFADFLGDLGARGLYSTRTLGGKRASEAVERLASRGEGTSARVSEDVQAATAQRGQSLNQLEATIENRRRMGNTLYERAFQHGEVANPDTLTMIQNPRVAEILKRASDRRVKVADLGGRPYQPLFRETDQGPKLARVPTVEDLHLLKTSLDDDIRQAYQAGEGQLGNALRDFKNRIVRNLEDEVPAYKQARETYKGDIEVEEAIASGRSDILRKPVDELRRDFSGLSGAEKDAYRSGAIDAILSRRVDAKVDSSDFARSLWGNADMRNRLSLLVKSQDDLERLVKQFDRERRIARTNRGVLGGSPTAMRSADIEDQLAGATADVVTQGPQAAAVSAIGRLIRRAGGMSEPVADDIAEMLSAEGPDAIRAVLKTLTARDQAMVAQAIRQQRAARSAAATSSQQGTGAR